MQKLEGRITISKIRCSDQDDYMKIEIMDSLSGTHFVYVKMSLADFTTAITGQGYIPVELEVRGLKNVGLVREQKALVFTVPNGTSDMKRYAAEHAQEFADKGWTADTHFESQDSIRYARANNFYFAHGRQYRYVKPSEAE